MATTKKRKPKPKQRRTVSNRHNPIRQKPDNQDEAAPINEPPPPVGGGGGGGGGGSNELGIPDLPPDVAAKIDQIFRQFPDNAQQRAISYLMTTPWFAQNYAGYAAGLQRGMFSDPFSGGLAQYRGYKTQVQNTFRQHYGREATNDELVGFLNQGFDAQRVEQIGQGFSIQKANQGDWQYYSGAFGGGVLTEEEKKAYAEEQAGIDTDLGQRIKQKVEQAIQRYQGVFQGQLGSSGLGDQQLSQRISRPKDIQA